MKKAIVTLTVVLMSLMLLASSAFAITTKPTPPINWEFYNQWKNPKPVALNDYLFKLDNNDRAGFVKHLWFYMEFKFMDFNSIEPNLDVTLTTAADPLNALVPIAITWKNLGSGNWSLTKEDWLDPQPLWETIGITAPASASDFKVTYTAMASECQKGPIPIPIVPEPASMVLLGSGLLGLIGIKRRKKN